MKQKLQDLILLIKQEKKYQVIAAGVGICVMYLMLAEPAKPKRTQKPQSKEMSSLSNQREAYDDLMSAMKSDLTAVSEGVKQNTRDLAELKVAQDKDRQRVAEIFKKMLDRLADVQATSASVGAGAVPQMLPEGDGAGPVALGGPGAGGAMGGAMDGSIPGSMGPSGVSAASYGGGGAAAMNGGTELASWGGAPSAVAPPPPPAPKKVAIIAPGDS
ncbi:MAG: hypothetical protein EBZ48_11425, partial [Proteobacteria bacterium]|nr:hypothetical protein [Pseudomonadota bacterium]